MIRILIVDDHQIVRRGIRDILIEAGDIEVIGEADGYPALRMLLRDHEPHVLLLDVNLPGKNGIDILKLVREEHPKLRIIMLSFYPEDQYALRALRAGASGYLNKNSAPEQLLDAVRKVHSGSKYITPEIAQALAENLVQARGDAPHLALSDREYQTLCLLASGKRLSDVASALALSPKTVSVYRSRILEKMGLSNNAELTHYALKHNLVE